MSGDFDLLLYKIIFHLFGMLRLAEPHLHPSSVIIHPTILCALPINGSPFAPYYPFPTPTPGTEFGLCAGQSMDGTANQREVRHSSGGSSGVPHITLGVLSASMPMLAVVM